MSWLGLALLALGSCVLLLAAVGLFVFQDALTRQHAATKAGSLGLVLIMAGTAVVGGNWAWCWRGLVIIAGVWLTLPAASHLLARAACSQNPQSDQGAPDRDISPGP